MITQALPKQDINQKCLNLASTIKQCQQKSGPIVQSGMNA
jgi:hypothetical protein